MNLTLLTKIQQIAQDNSNSILTGVGVAGAISTAILSARAAFKASQTIDREVAEQYRHVESLGSGEVPDLEFRDKFDLTWKLYIPPVGVGLITVSAIIMANRVAGKEAAALAAAYAVSEKALTDYREQVVKKLGEKKDEEIRTGVGQARMNTNPVNSREVIIAGTGEVLCFDILSGRYFQSSRPEIERAEVAINMEIMDTMSASLSEFYDLIGLPPTGFSDAMGFNMNRRCKVRFSSHLSSDDRPCLAIDFYEDPIARYNKLWD